MVVGGVVSRVVTRWVFFPTPVGFGFFPAPVSTRIDRYRLDSIGTDSTRSRPTRSIETDSIDRVTRLESIEVLFLLSRGPEDAGRVEWTGRDSS